MPLEDCRLRETEIPLASMHFSSNETSSHRNPFSVGEFQFKTTSSDFGTPSRCSWGKKPVPTLFLLLGHLHPTRHLDFGNMTQPSKKPWLNRKSHQPPRRHMTVKPYGLLPPNLLFLAYPEGGALCCRGPVLWPGNWDFWGFPRVTPSDSRSI